ncbi:MAG: ribosome small subunit-dependent GTPase A [Cyanobacteriota bacterium]
MNLPKAVPKASASTSELEGNSNRTYLGWVRAAQANFYRVRLEPTLEVQHFLLEFPIPDEQSTAAEILCTCRAKLKKTGQQVMVGDWVEVSLPPVAAGLWPERGVIEGILPRQTQLYRPAIANLTQALVVMALAEPDPDSHLLGRLLVQAEASRLRVQVILNKADCVDPAVAVSWMNRLQSWGYAPLLVSAATGLGIPALLNQCRQQISVVIGPSGVGKSSLLNQLLPHARLATQAVSGRLRQGRHTTRHVELFLLPEGGWIADSPGFNALEGIPQRWGVELMELIQCFPEVRERVGHCQFRDCLHDQEPGCRVRNPAWERYSLYRQLLQELQEAQERQQGGSGSSRSKSQESGHTSAKKILPRHRHLSRRHIRQTFHCQKLDSLESDSRGLEG